MTLPLRQKRRQETALHIQRATLALAVQKDLESVTTEEIAIASGVSTRTFFNYFTNKEAAAVGHPPGLSEEDKETLREGTAPIAVDIKRVLDRRMEALAEKEDILRTIGAILQSNEKARGLLEGFLAAERHEITKALRGRVKNSQTAASLAISMSSAIGSAIFLWEHEEDMPLGVALDVVWEGVIDASRLLHSAIDG